MTRPAIVSSMSNGRRPLRLARVRPHPAGHGEPGLRRARPVDRQHRRRECRSNRTHRPPCRPLRRPRCRQACLQTSRRTLAGPRCRRDAGRRANRRPANGVGPLCPCRPQCRQSSRRTLAEPRRRPRLRQASRHGGCCAPLPAANPAGVSTGVPADGWPARGVAAGLRFVTMPRSPAAGRPLRRRGRRRGRPPSRAARTPGPFDPARELVKYSTPMNSAPKLPAIANSHESAGIWVAWARIAATFASANSVPSIRAAISSSGVPNGRSSTFSTPANGLSDDSRNCRHAGLQHAARHRGPVDLGRRDALGVGQLDRPHRHPVRLDVVGVAVEAVRVVGDQHLRADLADHLEQLPGGLVEVGAPERARVLVGRRCPSSRSRGSARRRRGTGGR